MTHAERWTRTLRWIGASAAILALVLPARAAPVAPFSLEQILSYPFVPELTAAQAGEAIAFVRVDKGVRNIWVADGPGWAARQITSYTDDDGQELTSLTLSPDGQRLVYVRGGDHDANWPVAIAPNPGLSPHQPQITLWAASLKGGAPVKLAEGDFPAISAQGMLVFLKGDQVWTAALNGTGAPTPLFFDHGKAEDLTFSPDGRKLAFVSQRGDHSFIGIYDLATKSLTYLAPSTNRDRMPRWSPDGRGIAFIRQPGRGGAPEPLLEPVPHPFAIWVGTVADGTAHRVWQSPDTLPGSYPETAGGANLHWAAGDRLIFLADLDDWPHLYSVPATGGSPQLLTPGPFMVEHMTLSRDGRRIVYDANRGDTAGDGERRHLFSVPINQAAPIELTGGTQMQWSPVIAGTDHIAFIAAGAKAPPAVELSSSHGGQPTPLIPAPVVPDLPQDALSVPRPVSFQAADGLTVHGQLFDAHPGSKQPAIVFVHGGPRRQMLLGWHYRDYYANAYAVNQYLAALGYKVLSVNYRLGIGYGQAFQNPAHAGPAGAAEYQDVVAAAHFLQHQPDVEADRIGIWGGSYGGYLTALALARNSDLFKAGVDLHGVHDWSQDIEDDIKPPQSYEKGDFDAFLARAWQSSPVADIAGWTSPVLLIQGDDDHNVRFHQMVDLARRLDAGHVPYEELVIPNEIHGFLRWQSWLVADRATVTFFTHQLPLQ